MALKVFGASTADIASFGQLKVAFIAFILLILVIGVFAYIRDQATIPTGEDADYTKTSSVIFHPKVLGIVFVLLVAVFTIVLMAGKQT
jgi:predicted membrane channel-forming protein YqfA (hemolysin III family)